MTKKFKVLVVNGPNLNMLGKREPQIYGHITLDSINDNLNQLSLKYGIGVECFQSNIEGELITKVQSALYSYDFIIMNPGGFTHTSIALRDAVLASGKPLIEVHLSNIYSREAFRHKSFFSDIAVGVISGFGAQGYNYALEYIFNNHLQRG